jgi:DNA-binding NtrC family response regulator
MTLSAISGEAIAANKSSNEASAFVDKRGRRLAVHSATQQETAYRPLLGVPPPTILVIDDDQFFRSLVRILLMARYRVIEASNGLLGLRVLARSRVDLLITDIIMPEHEGIETILRAHGLYPQLKIMAVSGANSRHMYLKLATRIGANSTLEKAHVPNLLLKSVRALVEA